VASLEVTRQRDFFAVFRKLKIEVDGSLPLELSRDSTAAVQVDPGRHQVVARMDWERSLPLEVTCSDEEPTRLEVVTVAPFRALLAKFSGRKLIEVRHYSSSGEKRDRAN
jgi:hypothetical protein